MFPHCGEVGAGGWAPAAARDRSRRIIRDPSAIPAPRSGILRLARNFGQQSRRVQRGGDDITGATGGRLFFISLLPFRVSEFVVPSSIFSLTMVMMSPSVSDRLFFVSSVFAHDQETIMLLVTLS